jgi:hypothetical protein
MGEVTEFRTTVRLSISQIASEFGMSRNTVSARIAALGLIPDGKRGGYPVYRLRDVARIAATEAAPAPGADDFNPMTLDPMKRRAWFQSENERLKFETDCRHLVPDIEVAEEFAGLAKAVTQSLETLPDRAERDTRCGPEVVEYLIEQVRLLRNEIARRVEGLTGDEQDDARVGS